MSAFVELRDISFTYKKTGFLINGVSLMLHSGQTAVITGGNGSGKTTLGKLIMGIFKPERGSVLVDGVDISKSSLSETAKSIGYVFQNPERQLFCATAAEEIAFSLTHHGESKQDADAHAKALLERFSMDGKADEFPLKFSRGEKQRLALLAVFAMRPRFYILDEPSPGLDEKNKLKLIGMLEEIKSSGAGLCIITHDRQLISALADRVVTMENGSVISDESA